MIVIAKIEVELIIRSDSLMNSQQGQAPPDDYIGRNFLSHGRTIAMVLGDVQERYLEWARTVVQPGQGIVEAERT